MDGEGRRFRESRVRHGHGVPREKGVKKEKKSQKRERRGAIIIDDTGNRSLGGGEAVVGDQ